MKKIIVVLLVFVAMLSAAIVEQDRAKQVAENYYKNYAPTAVKGNEVQKILTKEYLGQPTWYVVQFTKGFVIVAAEDNVRPILGYSFTSPIDEDIYNMSNPFVKRFSAYDKQIVHVIREQNMIVQDKQRSWKDIENNIFAQSSSKSSKGPLTQDTFHQGYPFNDQCPGGALVGCVATSFTEIMRYWEGPAIGTTTLINSDTQGAVTASYNIPTSERIYDWTLMQGLSGGDYDTQEKIDEIAKFSLHTGVSVDMDWEVDASGTLNSLAVIVGDWGFTDAAFLDYGTITDSTVATTLIQTEINANRPLMWGGYGPDGGHAFVLDGYDVDAINNKYKYHFQWGWGGSYNGWFQLNDLTPGVSSFTEGQDAFYQLEVDGFAQLRPYPESLAATPNSSGDVTLTWNAPNIQAGDGTLVDYEIYKGGVFLAAIGGTTRTYIDPALPEGDYEYVVRAIYTSPDGSSFPSNIANCSVVPNPLYPAPIAFNATSIRYNRQKIDLTWTKPFTGSSLFTDGFEVGNVQASDVAGWIQRGSFQLDEPGMVWHEVIGNADPDDQGFVCSETTTHTGTYSMLTNDNNIGSDYYFAFPEDAITLGAGSMMTFWYLQEVAGATHHFVLYNGDFTESDPSPFITVVETAQMPAVAGLNVWAGQYYVDLSAYTGTYYVGIVKEQTGLCANRYDDFFIGSDTYPNPVEDQPTEFQIMRDGSLIATVPCTGVLQSYIDTDFADGWNSYYARAVYPGPNYSISGATSSAWMDANPVPIYLDGSYNDVNAEIDLAWYAPGHYPPHWFGWEFETDDWWYLEFADNEVYAARTFFTAEAMDMNYPVFVSEITCAFYEDAGVNDWVSDQFRYSIGTGSGNTPNVIYTSGTMTALPDGEFIDWVLPAEIEFNEPWYVEVQFINTTSATPSPMTLIHEEGNGVAWNSVWWYSGDGGEYDEGWYAYTYNSPYGSEDFMFYCYGYNNEPTITKNSTPVVDPNYKPQSIVEKKTFKGNDFTTLDAGISHVQPKYKPQVMPLSSSKALASYNIYREGVNIGNTANKFYSDTAPLVFDATYYVTTVYTDPVGESGPSNEAVVGAPAIIEPPAAIAETVAVSSTKDASFDIGNSGIGNLDYTVSYAYEGYLSTVVGGLFHENDFSTFPGTGYTTVNFVDGGGDAYIVGSRDIVVGSLTSGTFDTSIGANVYLDFDQNFVASASSISVSYYNGGSWTEIYTSTASTTASQHISLPDGSVSTQLRFEGTFGRAGGLNGSWTIDNISVTGDQIIPYTWLSLANPTGTVTSGTTNAINYTCDTDGLILDSVYVANVTITSNDTTASPNVIPFTLTVGSAGGEPIIPAVPANVVTSIVGTDLVIDWDDSADATGYDVYSSDDPYGTFTLVTGVT
ncbi:MAG: C10 family peptidase, partial [Candidatus Delongbacteria bacterium]|nr:C10 family peptidase [Candidatus Delongbacteria bacterium]